MHRATFVAAALVVAALMGCSDDDTMDCNLSTPAYTTLSAGQAGYLASNGGNSGITQIVYGGAAGPVTVNNPQLPLNLLIPVPVGASVFITATGSVNHGSINISHTFAGAGSETNQFQRSCAN